jgi:hypothetical protein
MVGFPNNRSDTIMSDQEICARLVFHPSNMLAVITCSTERAACVASALECGSPDCDADLDEIRFISQKCLVPA